MATATKTPRPRGARRKARPPVSAETVTTQGDTIERIDELKTFSVDCLTDHPANPPERVHPPALADLVQSIEAFGQREPVRARVMDADRLQILSGHRRVAACRILDRDVRVEVVVCSDAEALREVMLGNAERQDLDPIERAELLRIMINEGIDRAEAGAMFGLNSESGIKNALRIQRLPDSIKKLIRDGTIPARCARYLVPFVGVPKALDDFAEELTSEWDDTLGWFLKDPATVTKGLVRIDGDAKHQRVHARPIDGKTMYRFTYGYEPSVCGFEITPDVRKKLKVVEVPIDGKTVEVATNVKLFDKLNEPHLVKRSAYGGSPKKKTKAAAKSDKPLTPAQQKAEARRKRKEADAKLKERLPVWAARFLRCCLSFAVPANDPLIHASLPWLVDRMREGGWLRAAAETFGKVPSGGVYGSDIKLLTAMIDAPDIADRLRRVMVWPQHRDDWQPAELITDELPKLMPLDPKSTFHHRVWHELFARAELSIDAAWRQSALGGDMQAGLFDLVREYLQLHTRDQLADMATKVKAAGDGDTKGKLVDRLLAHHVTYGLPIPSCLQPKPAKPKATGGKKQ